MTFCVLRRQYIRVKSKKHEHWHRLDWSIYYLGKGFLHQFQFNGSRISPSLANLSLSIYEYVLVLVLRRNMPCKKQSQIWQVNIREYSMCVFGSIVGSDYNISPPGNASCVGVQYCCTAVYLRTAELQRRAILTRSVQ